MDAAESHARDLIQDWYNRGLTDTPLVYLVSSLAAAIRDAYERAAQVAQSNDDAYYHGIFGYGENEAAKTATDIAAAIRKLKGDG